MGEKIVSFQILPIEPKFYKREIFCGYIPFVAKYSMFSLYNYGEMGTSLSEDGIEFYKMRECEPINWLDGNRVLELLKMLVSNNKGYKQAKTYLSNAISKTKIPTDNMVGLYLSNEYDHDFDIILEKCDDIREGSESHLYRKVIKNIMKDGIKTCDDLMNVDICHFDKKKYSRYDISRIESLKKYLNGY